MTTNKPPDTAIIVESPNWKVKVYLGLAGLTVLTILAFLFRLEAGIIALGLGLAAAGRVALVGYHRHKLAGFERRRLEAETAKAEAEAVKARAASYFVDTGAGTFVLDGIQVARFYPSTAASRGLSDLPAGPLALPEPARLRRLLEVYPELIHLLVVGPSGAGKSTVLAWLIEAAPASARIVVIDPHGAFNVWPARSGQLIGTGRNWGAIDQALAELIRVMDDRYNGGDIGQKILIVCDEWLSVLDHCPNAERFFKVVGSEARKVNMHLVISSISATVDDLATSAAVRDNLAQLTLTRSGRAKNQAELKLSKKEVELVELPGRYLQAAPPPQLAPAPPGEFEPLGFDAGPVAPGPDPVELSIINMYQAGKSLRAIWLETHPGESYGGNQAAELKAILAKWGITEGL